MKERKYTNKKLNKFGKGYKGYKFLINTIAFNNVFIDIYVSKKQDKVILEKRDNGFGIAGLLIQNEGIKEEIIKNYKTLKTMEFAYYIFKLFEEEGGEL